MTSRPTLTTTPEDASVAKWMTDVTRFIDDLVGDERIPSAPKEITIESNLNSVKISFRAVNEVGVSEYEVYRGTHKNFSSSNADLIATIAQAITPASTTITYSDPEAQGKKFYFVRAVKGLRRPKLVGPVVGFGTAVSGGEISPGAGGGGTIPGFTGTPGSMLFVNDDKKIDEDNDNLFYSAEFKSIVIGEHGLKWGPHGAPDVALFRDASDILALRRGAIAQAFRVYEAFVATPPAIEATLLLAQIGGTNLTVFTTDSISPSANKLVLILVSASDEGFAGPITTVSVAGAGLTWVKVEERQFDTDAGPRRVNTVFRALGASPSAGALTITMDGPANVCQWIITEFSNIDTGGSNGADAVVQFAKNSDNASASITATLAAFSGTNNATVGCFTNGSSNGTWTPGSGFDELADISNVAQGCCMTFRDDNDITVDATYSLSGGIAGIALEIKNALPASSTFLELKATGATGDFEVMVDGPGGSAKDLAVGTRANGGDLRLYNAGNEIARVGTSGIDLGLKDLSFGSALAINDVVLVRDGAADTLAQRRAANAQMLNIYNTWTSATDNELGEIGWIPVANAFVIGTKKGSGGGTARAITFRTDEIAALTLGTDQNATFFGDVLLQVDDLGNDVPGRKLTVERNTNVADGTVGPAPAIFELEAADGDSMFLWVDDENDLRIHTAAATGNTGAPTVDANEDGFKLQVHQWIHFSFSSPGGGSGIFYTAGFYEAPVADANIDQGTPTQTLGSANNPYAAHAFVVHAAAGAAAGGSGVVEVEVSGTSITDAGVRQTSDTEIIIADVTAMSTDTYAETTKKWIGQVTYTIQLAGGATHTTFNADFNYGFAKYDDVSNHDFQVQGFNAVGRAGAADAAFNIEVLHHKATGWTYHASAFVPGSTPIVDFATLYSTESDLVSGQHFAFKRTGLTTNVAGSSNEGVMLRITTGANNSVETMDFGIFLALR